MFICLPRALLWAAVCVPCVVTAEPLSLDQALRLAVERSAAFRAAGAGVESASQAAVAASQLPDPTLRVGIENLPVTGPERLQTSRDSMTMKRVGISQEWLSQEKRAARQAAADALVERETVAVRVAVSATRRQTALATPPP